MESTEQTIRRLQRELKQKDTAIKQNNMHAIGRIKQWARMTDPYDGTVEEFREELAVCTGLVNFGLLWDAKRKRPSLDY